MSNIIMPSSPADRKRIKDCMDEVSASFLRQEAEKDFVKEAIASLEEDVAIPKKYLNKMARIYHKKNLSEIVSEIEEIEALIDIVSNQED